MAADVLDLVGDGAAVGTLQLGVGLGERGPGDVDAQHVRRDPRHDLGGEAERRGIERWVAGGLRAERVEPRGEVAEMPDRLHERHRRRHGTQIIGRRATGHGKRRFHDSNVSRLPCPDSRESQTLEYRTVEVVLSLQQALEPAQEESRLRALDDAVVVSARERHHLRRADLADGAGGDDRALALQEPRDGSERAERAGVGEGDGGPGEVVGKELVAARLLHQGLVGGAELREVHPLGVLDDGNDERAAPVLLLDVHRQAQVHGLGIEAVRLPLDLPQRVGHHGEGACRLDEGVADEMRVGDFQPARRQGAVQQLALGVEHVDGDVAERGRSGDGERVRHVLRETRGGAGERCETGRRDRHGLRLPFPASRFPKNFLAARRDDRQLGHAAVVEQLPPLLPHRLRVAQVLLVHHLHEGCVVRAEDELAHDGKSNEIARRERLLIRGPALHVVLAHVLLELLPLLGAE